MHSIKDVYYNLGATLKEECRIAHGAVLETDARAIQEMVWACIENMCDNAIAVGAGQSDVWLACKYRSISNDFEDNFVLAAAERANVDYIVTRDEKLLRKSTVPVFTPKDAIAYEKVHG